MDTDAGMGTNPVSKHQIQPEYGDEQANAGTGLPNSSCEIKFSGANGDMEIFIFPVQLATSRIGNHIRSILTPATCDGHTYIPRHSIRLELPLIFIGPVPADSRQ